MNPPVIYQHPLAYLLGLQGLALLRAFSGAHDRAFALDALSRHRGALLARADELGDGVESRPITTREGYALWAPTYDEPGNQLLEIEEPVVWEILDGLPVRRCARRSVRHRASRGPPRVARARGDRRRLVAGDARRAPGRRCRAPRFTRPSCTTLPLDDDSVDLVVCAIALSHVPELEPVLAELVRVLRPKGHLVISDSRGLIGDIGLPLVRVGPHGECGYMPVYSRLASDYLAAALPLGLQVRRCEEPRRPSPLYSDDGTDLHEGARPADRVPGEPPNIWSLNVVDPAATNAAWRGSPVAIVWRFQMS